MTESPPIDPAALAELGTVVLGWRHKAIGPAGQGLRCAEFLAGRPRLSDFQTPLLTLDRRALTRNRELMAHWCAESGVEIAPHGKTTMAPSLWAEQLAAGAWGITLANFAQLRVARAFAVRRVQLANSLTDPSAVAWAAREASGEDITLISWVDSGDTVETLQRQLGEAVLPVCVELGGAGGRTGARGIDAALGVARAVAAAPGLRLAGVAGYEGALAHDASPASLAAVEEFLFAMRALHERLLAEDLYEAEEILVTAGGSAYFDQVARILSPCATASVRVLVRAGAYLIHDDGFYRALSPLRRSGQESFQSAMHAWARVISAPEPGLALLDAGKRDVSYDEGLPEPQRISASLGGPSRDLNGARIEAVNDQHAFLRFDPTTAEVRIGDVVRLGLSHPCTALDKWTIIPVLDADGDDPLVLDLVQTFF
jgi:D-serine deaminase-like pyridoxal phosphate-dependent protein